MRMTHAFDDREVERRTSRRSSSCRALFFVELSMVQFDETAVSSENM